MQGSSGNVLTIKTVQIAPFRHANDRTEGYLLKQI